jgi:protein phosphatase
MHIKIPEFSLVLLLGPSGSGKSTFAARHFAATEVLSSDRFRGWVSDDENSMDATEDAFDALRYVAGKRLKRGRLTVIDATNVQPFARKPLLDLAREYHALPVAIVLNLPERVCQDRNAARPDRDFGPHVVRNHRRDLRRSMKGLRREGFRYVYELTSPEDVEAVAVERTKLWPDKRDEHGPFDIIGDIHGCMDELAELLGQLGYKQATDSSDGTVSAYRHPEGRRAVFVGDFVDRGPRSLDVVRTAMEMVKAGTSFAVPGNHDVKLVKKLRGKNVRIAHGLEKTLAEFDALPDGSRQETEHEIADFLDRLVSHVVLDGGRLVIAHAGMKEEMQGRGSGAVRAFALFGDTSGATDEFGLPVRHDWAAEYRGRAAVVYGHTPVPEAEWVNNTINIDTGCVFGGKLTALRWPERELVSVPARETYAEPARPFLEDARAGEAPARGDGAPAGDLAAQLALDAEGLHLADVSGKRVLETRLRPTVVVREDQAAAALETMSRFAADPRWLVYLPPTMSPSETSEREGYLEHPADAFQFYRKRGVETVVCEEKHMGSRAIAVVCRDADAAARRFGVGTGEAGIVYTRTGRRFFEDRGMEETILDRVRDSVDRAGWWDTYGTDWVLLDCELMPWSAKAQALLHQQYAPVGSAARRMLPAAVASLGTALEAGIDVGDLLTRTRARADATARYVDAYGRYCWSVESVDDLRLAPFHVLATEGAAHVDRDHRWHMERAAELTGLGAPVLYPTAHRFVDLGDDRAVRNAVEWWETMTEAGGEGMVIKPLDFIARGRKGLVQPAVKCRGREYLRIIYGPEYTLSENLDRLRRRNLKRKRSLALREFALGVEAIERFVEYQPLRRVHECVFGVLAMESDPVDPRL